MLICVHEVHCPLRPQEAVGSLGVKVKESCEPSDIGAGIQTLRSSGRQPSHLSSAQMLVLCPRGAEPLSTFEVI